MSNKCNHGSALAALKSDKTLPELSPEFIVHPKSNVEYMHDFL